MILLKMGKKLEKPHKISYYEAHFRLKFKCLLMKVC